MTARVIDSDAHVVEGAPFMTAMAERFPDKVQFAMTERGPSLVIKGRPYPKDFGPDAGCPPSEGLCLDRFAHSTQPLHERADRSADGKAKVLGGNAARFHGLN
jgi:hypothetical protein